MVTTDTKLLKKTGKQQNSQVLVFFFFRMSMNTFCFFFFLVIRQTTYRPAYLLLFYEMSKFISNLFIHSLKGKSVWYNRLYDQIDVACVMQIKMVKKKFCILDHDHPYSLKIAYYHSSPTGPASSALPVRGFIDNKDSRFTITRRYKTEDSCIQEFNQIKELQKRLENVYDRIVLEQKQKTLAVEVEKMWYGGERKKKTREINYDTNSNQKKNRFKQVNLFIWVLLVGDCVLFVGV